MICSGAASAATEVTATGAVLSDKSDPEWPRENDITDFLTTKSFDHKFADGVKGSKNSGDLLKKITTRQKEIIRGLYDKSPTNGCKRFAFETQEYKDGYSAFVPNAHGTVMGDNNFSNVADGEEVSRLVEEGMVTVNMLYVLIDYVLSGDSE